MGRRLVLLLAAMLRIGACVSSEEAGWTNYHLVIQLRKEGGRSTCPDEALIQLENDMNEWLYDELVQRLGTPTTFRLGSFDTMDNAHRADLQSPFTCHECNPKVLSRQLQQPTQGLVDLWIHQNERLLDGCVGDDTAVAVRLDLQAVLAS